MLHATVCRDVMPGLIDKLGDNKIVVRQANTRVLKMLMEVLRPRAVLEGLSGALLHSNWRVREEAVKMFTLVRLGSRGPSPWRAHRAVLCWLPPRLRAAYPGVARVALASGRKEGFA